MAELGSTTVYGDLTVSGDLKANVPWSGVTGKPAVIGAGVSPYQARLAIEAVGNALQLKWSGATTHINLGTLPGGHPGIGMYLIQTEGKLVMLYIVPGRESRNTHTAVTAGTQSLQTMNVVHGSDNIISSYFATVSGSTNYSGNYNVVEIYKVT